MSLWSGRVLKSGSNIFQSFGELCLVNVEIGQAALHDELGNALGLLLEHFLLRCCSFAICASMSSICSEAVLAVRGAMK